MLDLILIKITEYAIKAIRAPRRGITIIDRGYDVVTLYDHPYATHEDLYKFRPFTPFTNRRPQGLVHGFTGPQGLILQGRVCLT